MAFFSIEFFSLSAYDEIKNPPEESPNLEKIDLSDEKSSAPKRKTLSLNLKPQGPTGKSDPLYPSFSGNSGAIGEKKSRPGSKEQILQSLSHGRSKAVTLEIKRSRNVKNPSSLDNENPQKLTDFEYELRMRALQDSLDHEKETLPPVTDFSAFSIPEKLEPSLESTPLEESPDISFTTSEIPVPISETSVEGPEKKSSSFESQEESENKKKKSFQNPKHRLENPTPHRQGKKNQDKDFSLKNLARTENEKFLDSEEKRPVLGLKKLRKKQNQTLRSASSSVRCVFIKDRMSVKELALGLALKSDAVTKRLKALGFEGALDDLDADICQLVSEDLGFRTERASSLQDQYPWTYLSQEENLLTPRPPIVTVMGHVDHGKTSLLDALRKTDVTAKEDGGITQHLGAYQVHLASGQSITFIDTPGHQAFSSMRARGATLTDIVVLVVAADEGINAQTIEAIRHCQNANVPLVVAINKMDKYGANPKKIREALLQYEVVVEAMGGPTQDVEISALKNLNLDKLEEAILLQASLMNLQANPSGRAKAVVLETSVKKGWGAVASILIQEGTLRKGDAFVAGDATGRIRLMFDDKGKMISSAGPSQPVEVVGFQTLPQSGDIFMVAPSESEARSYQSYQKSQENALIPGTSLDLKNLLGLQKNNRKELAISIKADTQGSLEAIAFELNAIQHPEVGVKIVFQAIGPVNESDVLLAQTTQSMILAFHVSVLNDAEKIIKKNMIPFSSHRVIYHLVQDVKDRLCAMLPASYEETLLGRAEVIKIFDIRKVAIIAGSSIKEGVIRRGEKAKVYRNGKQVGQGTIKSLRHEKDDVKEKSVGYECGIVLDTFTDFQLGDIIECYQEKVLERTL